MLFISGVIETGLILRNSPYKGAVYDAVLDRLKDLECVAMDEYKAEFVAQFKKGVNPQN